MTKEDMRNEEEVQMVAAAACEFACADAWQNSQYGDELESGFAQVLRSAELTFRGHELRLTIGVSAQVPDDETPGAYPTEVSVALDSRYDVRGEAVVGNCISFEEGVESAYRKCMEALFHTEPWRSLKEAADLAAAVVDPGGSAPAPRL